MSPGNLVRGLLFALIVLSPANVSRAGSVEPTAPSATFTDTVHFDFTQGLFSFVYRGSDGTLAYEYAPTANGSFYPLTCVVNGAASEMRCLWPRELTPPWAETWETCSRTKSPAVAELGQDCC